MRLVREDRVPSSIELQSKLRLVLGPNASCCVVIDHGMKGGSTLGLVRLD